MVVALLLGLGIGLIGLLIAGKTWFGLGCLVLGVLALTLLARLPARNKPRRGRCA